MNLSQFGGTFVPYESGARGEIVHASSAFLPEVKDEEKRIARNDPRSKFRKPDQLFSDGMDPEQLLIYREELRRLREIRIARARERELVQT